MNFTTIQILAFVGAVAAMAIVFGLGYLEGRRAHRQEISRICQARAEMHETWRHKLERAQHEHTISRLNAAQALEHLTEELDALRTELADAQRRALTAEDADTLAEIAAKLNLAATVFTKMGSEQGAHASKLALAASAIADRYWNTTPLSTWERVDAEHTGAPAPQCM
ncbi:hypothetical protein D7243_10375 [Stutzerimonas stutzeri]|nr:hypothetical protein [Stutzerimonas stutzeri]